MVKKLLKDNKAYVLALITVLVVFSYFAFFNDHLFVFAGDSFEQQVKFYIQGWYRVRDGSLPFWDWSNLFGNNYFGASTFYFLGSPYFWLAMLSPKVELIPYLFLTLNCLKTLVAVSFAYIWLKKADCSDTGSAVAALAYSFSAFVMVNYSNNHMLDALSFVPLVMYSVELFLKDRKVLPLSLSIGYLGIVNYYFLYLTLPFVFVYVLIRYLFTQKYNLMTLIKDASIFTAFALLGVGISAITIIPSYMALSGNIRSSGFGSWFSTIGFKNIYRFITAFFNPVNDWRINSNYLISTEVNPGIGWGGGMQVYTFIIMPIALLTTILTKKSTNKASVLTIWAVYFAFAMIPNFYVLFNQNYESRWMFVFTLIGAFTIASACTKIDRKKLMISSATVIMMIIIFYMLSVKMGFIIESWENDALKLNVLLLSMLVIGYCVSLSLNNKYLIIIVCLAEIICSFYNMAYDGTVWEKPMNKKTLDSFEVFNTAVFDAIKEDDSNFYRIDRDTITDYRFNDAIAKRYNPFSIYHSVYNYRQNDFLFNRYVEQGRWVFAPQDKPLINTMLAGKYWYSEEEKYNAPFGYELYKQVGDISIYKNRYSLPAAYFMENSISNDVFSNLSQLDQDRLLLHYFAIENSANDKYQFQDGLALIKDHLDDQEIIEIPDEGLIYVVFSESNNSDYAFLDEEMNVLYGSKIDKQLKYAALAIPENTRYFKLQHNMNYYVYYDDMAWYSDWYKNISANAATDVVWDDNHISGTISAPKDGYVVTSVPYDKGWKLTVNGKPAKYEKVNNGFIGFSVSSDTAIHFELAYIPTSLSYSTIISVIALLAAIIIGGKYEKYRK